MIIYIPMWMFEKLQLLEEKKKKTHSLLNCFTKISVLLSKDISM